MIGTVHRLLRLAVLLAVAAAAALSLYALTRARPQDLPWTHLDLADPPGLFTGRKLAGLTGDPSLCRSLLERAGIAYTSLPPRRAEPSCGYDDAVLLRPGKDQIGYRPEETGTSCPVAAALKLWEWHVVQPAAQDLLGQPVRAITHFGSYSCRRLYGRDQGSFSEHATADAIDIAGFVLADGSRVTVAGGWRGESKEARFLKEARDGACGLFSTVLSPNYNAAHADHLHLDQAERGQYGGRLCR